MLQKNLDCHECDDILKKERGCTTTGIVPFYIGEERYFKCPLKIITIISWEYVTAFALYQKSILPNGGGWINESQKYLDAMIILDNEFKKIENENAKKANKHGRK